MNIRKFVRQNFMNLIIITEFIVLGVTLSYTRIIGGNITYNIDTFLILRPVDMELFSVWKTYQDLGKPILNFGYLFYYLYTYVLTVYFNLPVGEVQISYITFLIFITQLSFYYSYIRLFNISKLRDKLVGMIFANFYILNAYSLSVDYYFIENWTAYAIFVPLIFVVIYDLITGLNVNNIRKDVLLLISLSMLFSYGLEGPFLIGSIIIGFLIILLSSVFYKFNIKKIIKILATYSIIIFIIGSPYILVNEYVLHLSFLPTEVNDPSSLLKFMEVQSISTSLFSVFTFTGFDWMGTPESPSGNFPWYFNFYSRFVNQVLMLTLWLLAFSPLLIYGQIRKNTYTKLHLLLSAISLIVVFIMKTLQPPFGIVLYYLVLTRFIVFYLFVNPYYFIGQWLVYILEVLLLLGYFKIIPSVYSSLSEKQKLILKYIKRSILILLLISNLFWIFLVAYGQVYPNSKTSYLNMSFTAYIPEKLLELNQYNSLNNSYRGLMLPPYIGIAGYWTFGNRTIIDTTNFAYSLIGIPLIKDTISGGDLPVAKVALYFLKEKRMSNFEALMRYFGIKYVIINGYLRIDEQYYKVKINDLLSNLNKSSSFQEIFKVNNTFFIYEFSKPVYPEVFIPSAIIALNSSDLYYGFSSNIVSYLINNYSGYVGIVNNQTILTQIENLNIPVIQINNSILNSNKGVDVKLLDYILSNTKNNPIALYQYKRVNPSEWEVDVNTTHPFLLILSQLYSPYWIAEIYKNGYLVEKASPYRLFGNITGFLINETGNLRIIVTYTPQEAFNQGLIISAIIYIASVVYLSVSIRFSTNNVIIVKKKRNETD